MTQKKIKALLVDDETPFVEIVTKRLSKRGIDTTGVDSAGEALNILETDHFHVAVLDLCMPDIGGMELLKQIKARWPAMEVIMLTAHASMKSAGLGMELGAFDYLIKPLDIDELFYKIEDAYQKYSLTPPDG